MEKTVAVYLRVSTDKQSKGLEAQERAIKAYFGANKIENFVIFRDENVSGAKARRPQLDKLMEALSGGEHHTLIVYSFSRFARSTKHLLEVLEKFDRLGVAFISLTEKVDTSTPMGRAVFTIISAIAQLERELISERVKNGLKNAKAKGKRLGAPKTRPSKLIRDLASQGLSQRQIARIAGCSVSTVNAELSVRETRNVEQCKRFG